MASVDLGDAVGTAEAPANVLVLAAALSGHEEAVCQELLSLPDSTRENFLAVTFNGGEETHERLSTPGRHDGRPDRTGIITVGDVTRSASSCASPNARPTGPVSTEAIADPRDLTRLGNTLSNYLEEWERNANQTVVCFRSLTALLQHVEPDRALKFLHILTGRIRTFGASAHFHLDPGAHNEQTVGKVMHFFDAVVEIDEDGWTVRQGGAPVGRANNTP